MDFKNYFNIANKLNEMPQRYSTDHYSELGKFDFKEMNERLKKALEKYKLLKKETVQDIDFYLFDMGHDTSNDMISYSGYAVKDGNVIGYIVADDFQSIPKYPYPKVYVSKVHSDNQGKGIGTALYSLLINYFGGLVGSYNLSGNDKVAGSSHMWQKLMRMFPAYVITMNDYNTEIQNIEPVKNANNYDFNGENSKHQVFMVSKEPIESLKESPIFNDTNKMIGEPSSTNKHVSEKYYENAVKNLELFDEAKDGKYKIEGYRKENIIEIFVLYKDDKKLWPEVVGNLNVAKLKDYPFYITEVVFVFEAHQRQGLALAMYRMVIDHVGTLMSDRSLTGEDGKGGSFDVWRKLADIYRYKYIFDQTTKKFTPVETFERNNMDNISQRFVVSKRPLNGELKEAPVFDDIPKRMAYREPNDETTNTHEQDQDDLFNITKSSKIFNKTKVKDFTIVGYKNQRYYDIFCFFENKIVGKLTAFIDKNTDITPESQLAVVYKNYQRQGLALAMYAMVINDAGRLCSSNRLTGEDGTGGSFDIWVKLGKLYPYKYLYNDRTDKIVPVKEFNKDMMTDEHECFVVSKEEITYNGRRREEEESVNHRSFKKYFSNGMNNEL